MSNNLLDTGDIITDLTKATSNTTAIGSNALRRYLENFAILNRKYIYLDKGIVQSWGMVNVSSSWAVESREVNEINAGAMRLWPMIVGFSYCRVSGVYTSSSGTTNTVYASLYNNTTQAHTSSVDVMVILVKVLRDTNNIDCWS